MELSSIQITLDIYGHLFDDADFDRRQVELLGKAFNSFVRKPSQKSKSGSR